MSILNSPTAQDKTALITLMVLLVLSSVVIWRYFVFTTRDLSPEAKNQQKAFAQKMSQTVIHNFHRYVALFSTLTMSEIMLVGFGLMIALVIILASKVGSLPLLILFGYILFLAAVHFLVVYILIKGLTLPVLEDDSALVNHFKLEQTPNTSFNWSLSNAMQVFILFVEFFQLLSFPIQDLHQTPFFQGMRSDNSASEAMVDSFFQFFQTGTPNWNSAFMTTCRFILTFSTTLFAFVVTLISFKMNRQFVKKSYAIKYFSWILHLEKPVSIAYIPMLMTYISALKCTVDWRTGVGAVDEAERCYEFVIVAPFLYVILALLGYFLLMPLLTLYLGSTIEDTTSTDIQFTRQSVVVTKNASLMFGIVYLLLKCSLLTRGTISIVILASLIAYNVAIGSCSVKSINLVRTLNFSCVLYTSALVSWISAQSNALVLIQLGQRVYFVIVAGWIAVYFIGFIHSRVRQ